MEKIPTTLAYTIRPVRTPEDLSATISLIKTYTSGLGVDLSYQDFDSEMARMPGSYAPPLGELFIAATNNEFQIQNANNNNNNPPQALGCIALRELHLLLHGQPAHAATSQLDPAASDTDDGRAGASGNGKPNTKYCELKRLYVTPAARGLGVGKALVKAMLNVARKIGYEEVRLDTLPDMREAIAMYRGMGFGVVEKYYEKAIEGTVFLGLRL
ncbi:hypothetical protein EMCG_03413 [[Emmonsia] crescens]|uniref:N-acetyltransferase domain-containing protein n=1 Tax=[Emmonsia] crescens TaxID=73230 RepID=A0A0G2J088_9EURO|nr:hypothetical protein EMCG_03413 [Emmonsia crescens UAMH 3008]